MSTETSSVIGESAASAVATVSRPRVPSTLRRAFFFPVKFFWGMIFCQGLVGSIFVIGWTYRFAQRSVWKHWWSRSGRREQGGTFAKFLAENPSTRAQQHWPNWFLCQRDECRVSSDAASGPAPLVTRHASRVTRHLSAIIRFLFHSLWLNFWIGLRATLNTSVLVIPASVLWWFGWYDGWNNSFTKGYEQAPVGPLISIFGILLFIAVMFYLPMAQARQAATGEWRTFYQFRLIWKVVRLRYLASAGLALAYCAFALPLNILKTAPIFWSTGKPAMEQLTNVQVLKALDDYFFWCALLMLPAYVILRLVAARIYASGILALVESGAIQPSALAENERDVLERLGLAVAKPRPAPHRFVRLITWAGSRVGRIITGAALFFIWFSFVAQIYIAEFFNNHGGRGWLNQPLVQLPWFHYVPARLKNPIGEIIGAIVFLLATTLIASVRRAWQRQSDPTPAPVMPAGTSP